MQKYRGLPTAVALGGLLLAAGGVTAADDSRVLLSNLRAFDRLQLDLGRLAQTNTASPDVRQFGEQLVGAFRDVEARLADYARAHGVALASPVTDSPEAWPETAMLAGRIMQLGAVTGPDFDREFLSTIVRSQDDAIRHLDETSGQITDPALRALIQRDIRPALARQREGANGVMAKEFGFQSVPPR